MIKFLPVLSESLKEIVVNLSREYPEDQISKEILRVHNIMAFYLANKDSVPEICPIFEEELNKSLKNEVTMLSGRYGEEFEISFLPTDREPIYTDDGKWARANRQTGKPGRIFQKLIAKEFKQYDWEQFVNRFKATMCCSTNFELVQGSDITYWYNEEHYYRCQGTLGNSCMKYSHCAPYFKVYEDHAKMLITTKGGLLTGRAIVWELEDGTTILDRIYTCFDYLENCFIEYAKDHKWWIRQNNHLLNNGDDQAWYSPDDDYANVQYKNFEINIGKAYDYFPYVDSFRYFNGNNKLATSAIYDTYLSNTDGSWNQAYTWECEYCGATFNSEYEDETPEELHYSEYSNGYYCDDCCWWCEYLDDYIVNSDEQVKAYDEPGSYIEVPRSWVLDYNYVELADGWYNPDEFEFKTDPITGDKILKN